MPEAKSKRQGVGRLLALDVGEKRVGMALCDETQTLARPLLTLNRTSKKEDFAKIAALCREHAIEKVIVGLPKTLRGEEGSQAQRVRRYAGELQASLNLPIEFWDERYSSVDAQERLTSASRKARAKGDIDSAAAAIILQEYLDEHHAESKPL
jgi:putative Holliday junction resolvase